MTVRSKERCYKVTFDGKLTRVVCDAKISQSPAKSIEQLPQPLSGINTKYSFSTRYSIVIFFTTYMHACTSFKINA